MDKSKWGVHIAHCCVLHGCKYGDSDCPVKNSLVQAEYVCEECQELELEYDYFNVDCKDGDKLKNLNMKQVLELLSHNSSNVARIECCSITTIYEQGEVNESSYDSPY